jgi:acyl dehydratase
MAHSGLDFVEVGQHYTFSKTVSETDIVMFAGISGDFAEIHVNEHYARARNLPGRIAHGVLTMAYMSSASTVACAHIVDRPDLTDFAVSAGYDKVRFLRPVLIGDTLTVHYTVQSIDRERGRDVAKVEVVNHRGETVAVAEHVMRWLKKEAAKAAQ